MADYLVWFLFFFPLKTGMFSHRPRLLSLPSPSLFRRAAFQELSTLVDQKMAGEIGEADFRASLFRLLDIKHARRLVRTKSKILLIMVLKPNPIFFSLNPIQNSILNNCGYTRRVYGGILGGGRRGSLFGVCDDL